MERTVASIVLVLSLLTPGRVAAFGSEPISDPVDVPVEGVATESQVGRAIKAALSRRGWVPGAEKTRYMEGTLIKPDSYLVKIGISYDAKHVKVRYLDSEGLDYDPGAGTIKSGYNKWMRMLSKEISVNLTLFASGEPEVVTAPPPAPEPVKVVPVLPSAAPAAAAAPGTGPVAPAGPAPVPASAPAPAALATPAAPPPSQLRAGAAVHAQAKLGSPLMGSNAVLTTVNPKGPVHNTEGTWWYVTAGSVSGWVLQSDLQ